VARMRASSGMSASVAGRSRARFPCSEVTRKL